MKNLKTVALAASLATLLTACGGGGSAGGAGQPAAGAPASTLSVITLNTSTTAAANAYDAASSLQEAAETSGAFVTGVSVSRPTDGVARIAVDLFQRTAAKRSTPILTGVEFSEPCEGGGNLAFNTTVKNEDKISSGDRVSLVATNCVIDGASLNGRISLAINSLTGEVSSFGAYAVDMSVIFADFMVNDGEEVIGVAGDMNIAFGQTDSSNNTFGLRGNSLSVSLSRGNAVVARRTLTGYDGLTTTKNGVSLTGLDYGLYGTSSVLGEANVEVRTLRPFLRNPGFYPSSGILIVNGAASSVTLRVIDSTSVQLDFSERGDGVITSSRVMTWAELETNI